MTMKKNVKRIYKIIIASLMVISLNMNTFATLTGNDGSQFVTKAEFDSIMKDFNKEMDAYNSGLNAKIDVAISSYLAGLSSESKIDQTSLINSINPKFVRSWEPFTSRLGDKFLYYLYCCFSSVGTPAGSSTRYHGECKVSNNNGNQGAWKTAGTNTGIFARYSEGIINGTKVYYPNAKIESTMKSVMTIAGIGVMSNIGAAEGPKINPFVVAAGLTEWGSEAASYSVTWGTGANLNGVKSFAVNDTITVMNGTNFYYLPGNAIDTGDVYSILDDDYQMIGDKYTDVESSAVFSNYREIGGTSKSRTLNRSDYKLSIYRHKYNTLKWTDFCHQAITQLISSPAKYYNGCPLFTATDNGKAVINLIFENTVDTATNMIMIDNNGLQNTTSAGSHGSLSNFKINGTTPTQASDYLIVANESVEFTFDAVKGKTYWLKISPSEGDVNVKSTNIVISKNN